MSLRVAPPEASAQLDFSFLPIGTTFAVPRGTFSKGGANGQSFSSVDSTHFTKEFPGKSTVEHIVQAAPEEPFVEVVQQPTLLPQIVAQPAPCVPQAVPQLYPQVVPQAVPQVVPQAVPQAVQHAVPNVLLPAVAQGVPQAAPHVSPYVVQHAVPQAAAHAHVVPQAVSQAMLQDAPLVAYDVAAEAVVEPQVVPAALRPMEPLQEIPPPQQVVFQPAPQRMPPQPQQQVLLSAPPPMQQPLQQPLQQPPPPPQRVPVACGEPSAVGSTLAPDPPLMAHQQMLQTLMAMPETLLPPGLPHPVVLTTYGPQQQRCASPWGAAPPTVTSAPRYFSQARPQPDGTQLPAGSQQDIASEPLSRVSPTATPVATPPVPPFGEPHGRWPGAQVAEYQPTPPVQSPPDSVRTWERGIVHVGGAVRVAPPQASVAEGLPSQRRRPSLRDLELAGLVEDGGWAAQQVQEPFVPARSTAAGSAFSGGVAASGGGTPGMASAPLDGVPARPYPLAASASVAGGANSIGGSVSFAQGYAAVPRVVMQEPLYYDDAAAGIPAALYPEQEVPQYGASQVEPSMEVPMLAAPAYGNPPPSRGASVEIRSHRQEFGRSLGTLAEGLPPGVYPGGQAVSNQVMPAPGAPLMNVPVLAGPPLDYYAAPDLQVQYISAPN